MQGSLFSRSVLIGVLGLLILVVASFAGATVAAKDRPFDPNGRVVSSGSVGNVGLALDTRGNLYTADSQTGHVYCVPPQSSAVLLAKVPGTPTVLTVDKLRNVFVGTESGEVFLVSLDGLVAEVYRCAARPVGLSVDRDGGLVVATEDGVIRKVERVDFLGR